MEPKKSSVLRQIDKYASMLQEVLDVFSEIKFEDFHDESPVLQKSQALQEAKPEEQKAQEAKLLSAADQKRALENKDKVLQLLSQLDPNYADPRYLQFEPNSEKTKRQNAVKFQQMWEQVKLAQKERFSKYTDDKQTVADDQLPPDYEYTLHYQQGTLKKTIQVKLHDVLKLNPPNYLNDSIINFYLKLIETELIPDRQKVYIFNTYFMEKLCPYERLASINDGQKLNELFKGCYENIKKWVKEDLFEKDYLLFPLNLPEHWSLLIAHKPILATEGGASIIYLDSFGIMDQKIITIIKMYLHKIYSEKFQNDTHYNESPIKQIPAYQLLVPRQVNYVDCGVFLLEYAESFLMNPEYLLEKIDTIEGLNKLRLFPRTLVNRKRMLVKQLMIDLLKLSKEQAIANYKQHREEITEECAQNDDEYDKIDQDLFKEFLSQKNMQNANPEQYRQMLLDFYMNPQQNYYHMETHTQ